MKEKYYWDKYSLREKLLELGELSCRRNYILLSVMEEIDSQNEEIKEIILKLLSGVDRNILHIGALSDELINLNNKSEISK